MGRAQLIALLLGAAALAATGAGWAQDETPPPCAWETAQRISVRALERSGDRLRGQCVRVVGRINGRDLADMQRPPRGNYEDLMVGAYFDDEAMADSFFEHPRRVEALGRVGLCEDICADAGPDVFCMATGYCHYHGGPYVLVKATR